MPRSRQRHAYDAAMKALVSVMVDRRAKGFEIAARPASVATMLHILAALVRINRG
jgi:hypothetical protein